MHNWGVLTLGEVLEHEAFGLRLLSGGTDALERPVAGAHSSEMVNPSRFLPAEWLMLTLGMRLADDDEAQSSLIAELDRGGLAALGFGVGETFDVVPGPLLEAAESRGFPVFEIPHATPYREIVGFVNRSLLSTDFQFLHRSLGMQTFLMDALREEDPILGLVERLDRILESTVILFDDRGEAHAASREVATERIWSRVEPTENATGRAMVEGSDVIAVPIEVAGQPRRWLVIASRVRSMPPRLTFQVIQSTERLLELIAIAEQSAVDEQRSIRSGLLASALQPLDGYDSAELDARIRGHGLDLSGGARLVAIEGRSDADDFVLLVRTVVEQTLDRERVAHLITTRAARVLVLSAATRDQLAALVVEVEERTGSAVLAGCSRELTAVDELAQGLADSSMALRGLERRSRTGLLAFEDYDFASWLVGSVGQDDLAAKADALLAPLLEQPQLFETLVAYLRADARVTAAAAALDLHENSLRYRLARIEELLDLSLRDLPTLVDVYLAVLARTP